MDKTVDGCGGCRRVFEDPFPLREGQVTGDHDTTPLIALGKQREEHFHLLTVLLDVSYVIDDDQIIACEAFQYACQCMSSDHFGQLGDRTKRDFSVFPC